MRGGKILGVIAAGCLGLMSGRAAEAAADPGIQVLPLVTVWRSLGPDRSHEKWRVGDSISNARTNAMLTPAFRAVASREWPTGLVPIFGVEKEQDQDRRFELRRLPPQGRENFTDPLFFALPPEQEPSAARLAGRWNLISHSREGRQHRLAMQLTTLGEQAAGRLDQDTDYRFAFLTGGTWRSNRLEITVEYINDRYQMTAEEGDGRLTGEWRQIPDGDAGVWEAKRPEAKGSPPPATTSVPLYEWRSLSSNARQYLTGDESPGAGWRREDRALCRVWPKALGP